MTRQSDIERDPHEPQGRHHCEASRGGAASDLNADQGSVLRRVSIVGAAGAMVIALLGLLAYVPGLGLLGSIREGYIPMAPSTAISFIVLGGILLALRRGSISGASLILMGSLAALVSVFGALEVAGYCIGKDLNFEDVLVPSAGYLGEIPLARMSPSTGASFFLAGLAAVALLLRVRTHGRGTGLGHWGCGLGSLVMEIGLIFCLAYLYGSPLLYGRGTTVPMSLTTALAFVMLGAGAMGAGGKDAIPVRLLVGTGSAEKPISARGRFILLTFLMLAACTMVLVVITVTLYRHEIQQHRRMLRVIIQGQARLIYAIARDDAVMSGEFRDAGVFAETLSQVISAHEHFDHLGEAGEIMLARLDGDSIVFVLRHRQEHGGQVPSAVAFDSEFAEPMRRALQGMSGTVIGPDYQGTTVLAAYEPLAGLNMGLVSKIDMAAIRVPFFRAGLTAATIALFIVLVGAALFMRIGNPIIARLEAHSRDLEEEVNERRQSEDALRKSEAMVRAITTAARDAIVIMDQAGVVAFWNDAAERIFGWTRVEVMGRELHEIIFPTRCRDTESKVFPFSPMTEVDTARGQTIRVQARRKDGTDIPIELSLSSVRLDGKWCVVGIARDISDRVETERTQARLKAAIEAASETIVITDTSGVIQYANPAFERNTGYTCEEAVGRNPGICNSGHHDKAFYEELWGTIGRGETWHGHFVNKRKDGTLFHEEATISPIKNESGKIINYVSVKRDVTQQRILEGQLLQAQKLESIGQLAAGIAHEISTPIQYVGDNTRFVRDSVADLLKLIDTFVGLLASAKDADIRPEQIAAVESAIEELDLEFAKKEIPNAIAQTLDGVDRVAEIVRAMKDFSHPGSEDKSPTDLNRAIESTITVCRSRWKYVADLETDFEEGLPAVPCLVGEFNQVILNMIVNAADAIGDIVGDGDSGKGRIIVSTRLDGAFVEIRVVDTGGGIPEKIQIKVFDPFFTTKEVGQGTGQGLAISHDVIVNKHGGTITFEVDPGVGTTFIVRVPLAGQSTKKQREAA